MHLLRLIVPASLALGACTPSTLVIPQPELTGTAVATLSAPAANTPLAFSPSTYRDDQDGFELDYPSDWTATPNSVVGSRASQAQLFSPGTTADKVAPGGSRLGITVYQWDPKGDLGAYVAHRRTAWDGGGFKVREGSLTQLPDGRPASDFFIEAPDGALAYFLLTTVGDKYLELAGEGELALTESVAHTLRPLSAE